jgi:NAD(P)-dependent dehydrogenase (short-subunit alcohol dehydrogenase family)
MKELLSKTASGTAPGTAAPESLSKRSLLGGLLAAGATAPAMVAPAWSQCAAPPLEVRSEANFYPTAGFVPQLSVAGKVTVITGASRGIGLATALALQAQGAIVLGTSRTPASYALPFPLLQLDLADPASTATFLATVGARPEVIANGGIDILLNNAGRFVLGGVIPVDPELFFSGIQLGLATLYGGHIAVTSGLLPQLAARAAVAGYARIVFTASIVAYGVGGSEPGTSYYHAYTSGKRSVLAYANCLRGLIDAAGLGIKVSTVNPLSVNTDLASGRRPIFLQPVDAAGNALNDANFQAFIDGVRAATAGGLAPGFAAQAYLQLLTSANPHPNVAIGSYSEPMATQGQTQFVSAVGLAEMKQSAFPWVAGPPRR